MNAKIEERVFNIINGFRFGKPVNKLRRDHLTAHHWVQVQWAKIGRTPCIVIADAWGYVGREFIRLTQGEVKSAIQDGTAICIAELPEFYDYEADRHVTHWISMKNIEESVNRVRQSLDEIFGLNVAVAYNQFGDIKATIVAPLPEVRAWVEEHDFSIGVKDFGSEEYDEEVHVFAVRAGNRHGLYNIRTLLEANPRYKRICKSICIKGDAIKTGIIEAAESFLKRLESGLKWGRKPYFDEETLYTSLRDELGGALDYEDIRRVYKAVVSDLTSRSGEVKIDGTRVHVTMY